MERLEKLNNELVCAFCGTRGHRQRDCFNRDRAIRESNLLSTDQTARCIGCDTGKIRRTLSASKEGRYSELIPIQQLANELQQISASLEGRQKLPMDPYAENTMNIFKYSRTKATLFNRKLMIELSTPAAEGESFTLFKTTLIPLKTQNGLVLASITSTHFLLNEDQTKYYALSEKELENGIMLADNQTLYRPTSPAVLNPDATRIDSIFIISPEGARSK